MLGVDRPDERVLRSRTLSLRLEGKKATDALEKDHKRFSLRRLTTTSQTSSSSSAAAITKPTAITLPEIEGAGAAAGGVDQAKKAKVSQLSALQATIKQMRRGTNRKEETKNSPPPQQQQKQEEQEQEEMKENRKASSIARLREACALPSRTSCTSYTSYTSSSSARKASERAVLATPPRPAPAPAPDPTIVRAKRSALLQKNATETSQNKVKEQQEEGRLEVKEVVKEEPALEERRVVEVEVEVVREREEKVVVLQQEEVSLLDDGYRNCTSEEVEAAMATGWREFSSLEAFEEQQRQLEQEQAEVVVEAVGGKECVEQQEKEEEQEEEEEEEVVTYFEEGAALMVSIFRAVLTALVDGGGGAGGGVLAFLPESVAAVVRVWITPLAALGGVAEVLLSFFLLAVEVVAEGVRFLWSRFRFYQPTLLVVTCGGLVTAFWGAHFPLTLAALEALLLANCLGTLRHLRHLLDALHAHYLSHSLATATSASATASSGEGATASRLSLLLGVMKAVDPQTVAGALTGVNAALLAVVTTLRLRFAQTIALGNAMAASLEGPLEGLVGPVMGHLLGSELEAWTPYLLAALVRLVTVVLAWRMRRVLSAYHSALRGGLISTSYGVRLLVAWKFLPRRRLREKFFSAAVIVLGYALALLGLYYQLTAPPELPAVVAFLLLPLRLTETVLMALASYGAYLMPAAVAS